MSRSRRASTSSAALAGAVVALCFAFFPRSTAVQQNYYSSYKNQYDGTYEPVDYNQFVSDYEHHKCGLVFSIKTPTVVSHICAWFTGVKQGSQPGLD